ncbi:hypothetical protein HHL16_13540 [Pseudoflavitalea sp. G-6-1-2]|uniref:hypothetical protein n=1 Tax=Pseudoflavitalea sp. G-6-1-2 TaxID=2728841 RepID=UPI00146C9D57|nr:hypothetical protein [Pseudoflavitalea sp. G-6-1-2]NML21907.1 hypothetical protein [Pseudoflavitalea sp. G-6-1-2]
MATHAQTGKLYGGVINSMCGKTSTGGFNNSQHRLFHFKEDTVGILDYEIEFKQDDRHHLFSGTHGDWTYYKWTQKGNTITIQGKQTILLTQPPGNDYELLQKNSSSPIHFSIKHPPQPAADVTDRSYAFEKDNTSTLISFTKDSLQILEFDSGDVISAEKYGWLAVDEIILIFGPSTQQLIFWNRNNTISLSDGRVLGEIKTL